MAEASAALFLLHNVTVNTFTLQLDKDVLTDWSVGGCKENSTTLIKTSCAKKTENITTDLTTLSTTTIMTTSTVGTTTEAGYDSCLTDPDGTCHFLFYDTSLTDTQIGIILLIASLIILCTALIIIVKILNSMMKGRYLTLLESVKEIFRLKQGSDCVQGWWSWDNASKEAAWGLSLSRAMHYSTLGLVSCSCL